MKINVVRPKQTNWPTNSHRPTPSRNFSQSQKLDNSLALTMSLTCRTFLLGICLSLCVGVAIAQPSYLAIDPPSSLHGFLQEGLGPSKSQLSATFQIPTGTIGSVCVNNVTCTNSNGICLGGTCVCAQNFVEEPGAKMCRIAPGYNEPCMFGKSCREPFTCNSTAWCDCPVGFIEEYFQCVKDCPSGQVPINDTCYQATDLNGICTKNEQCSQSYTQCLHGKCQCIQGAAVVNGQCVPVSQCPLGDPSKDKSGNVVSCKADGTTKCPKDFYCIFAEFTDAVGFCCPKIKMNCPIGQPLEGFNCSNCPWDSHHCFSYVIGSYTETICCPNACPSSQPIHKNGKCFARSAFSGNCEVSEQCYSVVGAVCRSADVAKPEAKKCYCPEGPYTHEYGQCLRTSYLDEPCAQDRECRGNTKCTSGLCKCMPGWMSARDGKTCIPRPNCPLANPPGPVQTANIKYCEPKKNGTCGNEEFCHNWWRSTPENDNKVDSYSLCCAKPKPKDFEVLCAPHLMKLRYTEAGGPRRCHFTALAGLFRDDPIPDDSVKTAEEKCLDTDVCIFDPYLIQKGVCCQRPEVPVVPDQSTPLAERSRKITPPKGSS